MKLKDLINVIDSDSEMNIISRSVDVLFMVKAQAFLRILKHVQLRFCKYTKVNFYIIGGLK